ncbi:MAG: dockerin type I repeat-containing protein [Clostridiales bacterium]|nr:dockerin type I repeat-containing protein [Clostridiales bacterium]MCI1961791.1 dockerin type I repeat-containing protein [Clostridiales bacterium]MCI2022476.1 dockerin type I repeat-containing protein [Clostridiales bacterium]MCI2026873.1 dockerin type I repeat-containing protein [Clostridiales bacterium]
MRKKRKILIGTVLTFIVAVVLVGVWQYQIHGAEKMAPTKISDEAAFKQNRMAFPLGSQWVIFSTDGQKTRLALVENSGKLSKGTTPMELEGSYLFGAVQADKIVFVGFEKDRSLSIEAVSLSSGETCEWSGFLPEDSRKCSDLYFDSQTNRMILRYYGERAAILNYKLLWGQKPVLMKTHEKPQASVGVPLPDETSEVSRPFESSAESSSKTVSSKPDSSSSLPISSASSQPNTEEENYYIFDEPITVSQLKETFNHVRKNKDVEVITKSGYDVSEGAVVTGDQISFLDIGGEQKTMTAVILGDLTGSGKPDSKSLKVFYPALAYHSFNELQRRAADLDGDGTVTTSDLLLLKKRILYGTVG